MLPITQDKPPEPMQAGKVEKNKGEEMNTREQNKKIWMANFKKKRDWTKVHFDNPDFEITWQKILAGEIKTPRKREGHWLNGELIIPPVKL